MSVAAVSSKKAALEAEMWLLSLIRLGERLTPAPPKRGAERPRTLATRTARET